MPALLPVLRLPRMSGVAAACPWLCEGCAGVLLGDGVSVRDDGGVDGAGAVPRTGCGGLDFSAAGSLHNPTEGVSSLLHLERIAN